MIPSHIISQVKDVDIVDLIGKYVSLKKKGAGYEGNCPFHNEKTPSFKVNPAKGIFKCFGCGKAGDAVGFVMEHKSVDFLQAVRAIAADFSIDLQETTEEDPEAEKKYKHQEAIYVVNKMAADFFREMLLSNEKAMQYVKGRWSDETIDQFGIGFAPDDWHGLMNYAKTKGINQELLLECGLLSESKNQLFDTFRNRIMFPILNKYGRVTGFTGRTMSDDKKESKYFNSRESEQYSKSEILYGMNYARRTAKERGYMHLVEGNPDVMRLHEIGKLNTVGTCGTALTRQQILQIKEVCNSITIIGDSDKAGRNAMIRSGEMIIREGMYCNVVLLPDDQKNDPDSFFTDADQFDEYVKANMMDYIFFIANSEAGKAISPDKKTHLVNKISDLIFKLPATSTELYIEKLAKIIKPKNIWKDAIKSIQREQEPEKEDAFRIPKEVSLSDFEKFGFYQENNCYFFRTKSGIVRGTNFVMEPLFHISSVLNAKRIFRITNEFGYEQVIELAQRDLIGLGAFRLRVESIGNFLFEASEFELGKLKRYLYEKTDSCFEIVQLGWQKQGFWAWCNGIFYKGMFYPVDDNGIVAHSDINYYLPASSRVYAAEETLFVHERRFKFSSANEISLFAYSTRLINVFGENASYALCFYFATLFRDIIYKRFGFFPILNLFGPKGAGKTELAISLLQFFGHHSKGPNMTNTTKPALADHIGMFSNAIAHLDEYKNSLEMEKIEFLKGLWDGTGRTRMNMDKDKKKETSSVESSIVLSGQEMPTADIALFSRLIFLPFARVEYTDAEKVQFTQLKEIENLGLSHITQQILQHRELFINTYFDQYAEVQDDITTELNGMEIEARVFRNWLVIMAAYKTLESVLDVPFNYKTILSNAVNLIVNQNHETKKSNDQALFWTIVEYLASNGEIREEVDYRIDYVTMLKTDTVDVMWPEGKEVLFLNHTRVYQLYRIHGIRAHENILPTKTLEYYLQHSKEYLGKKLSVAFKIEDNGRVVADQEEGLNQLVKNRKITTAMVFDYKALKISLLNEKITESIDNQPKPEIPF